MEGDEITYWFSQVLLLFHLQGARKSGDTNQFSFVPYFDVTRSIDQTDETLPCVIMLWAPEDEVHLAFAFALKSASTIEAGTWYGLLSLLFSGFRATYNTRKLFHFFVYPGPSMASTSVLG